MSTDDRSAHQPASTPDETSSPVSIAGVRRKSLPEQRLHLQARSSRLRLQWAAGLNGMQGPMDAADQVLAAVRWGRQHPGWLLVPALVLAALRPRHIGRWSALGWSAWKLWQRLRLRREAAGPYRR